MGRDPTSQLRRLDSVWDYGDFTVTVVAVIGADYGVVIPQVTIEADSVTVGMLQKMKLGKLRERIYNAIRRDPSLLDIRAKLLDMIEAGHGTMSKREQEVMTRARNEVQQIARNLRSSAPARGRGAENREWHRMIAEMYLAMLDAYGPRGVIQAMARELDAKPNTVSQWVRKARLDDWITDAPGQGRAGGEAGPKLEEWRTEHES